MIVLITGATHTGKTRLAQRLMEKYKVPYLSQDHLKMGLIRSGYTSHTSEEPDEALTAFLWPITREIVKTAIENRQSLIVEGCYIPFSWREDFTDAHACEITYICLCFSAPYIDTHFSDIQKYARCMESRPFDEYCTPELLKRENRRFLQGCQAHGLPCVCIDSGYEEVIDRITL